ncbi:hypothetical protein ES705_48022 [subsurface metagenome]
MGKLKKGWGFPSGSRKAHFFDYDGNSLCGKWMLTGKLYDKMHHNPDNCKDCMRKRDKLYPKRKE